MTGYEMVLLARAVDACDRRCAELDVSPPAPHVPIWGVSVHHRVPSAGPDVYEEGDTLGGALRALLRDLGEDAPDEQTWRDALIDAWADGLGFRDDDGVWHPGATEAHANQVNRFLALLEGRGS